MHTRGWSVEEAARHLHLTPARTELLIAGDITAFSLNDLRSLDDLTRAAVPGETTPPPAP